MHFFVLFSASCPFVSLGHASPFPCRSNRGYRNTASGYYLLHYILKSLFNEKYNAEESSPRTWWGGNSISEVGYFFRTCGLSITSLHSAVCVCHPRLWAVLPVSGGFSTYSRAPWLTLNSLDPSFLTPTTREKYASILFIYTIAAYILSSKIHTLYSDIYSINKTKQAKC